jgi:hypothetical protein
VEHELGEAVDWLFQPYKIKFYSYPGVLHHLLLARFLVACRVWCRARTDFALLEERTSYEIAREPPRVTLPISKDKKRAFSVIPDAWSKFALFANGAHTHDLAVLFELDRGMEHGRKFKEHIRGRLELIRSGEYQRVFGVPGVVVAYLTTGQTPEYRQTRCQAMNAWTQEVLRELNLKSWGGIFRFTAVEYEKLYGAVGALFAEPVWYRPDAPLTPAQLVPA